MKTRSMLGLLVILFAGTLAAQDITGTIVGTVKDATGAVVSNATVTVTNTDKNVAVRVVTTGPSGNYVAPLLPPAHYSVSVEAPGFKKAVTSGIVLNVNDRLAYNFTLVVGGAGETVNVEAAAAQVDTQSAAATGVVTGQQIRTLSLPNRNYMTLLTLVPGVTSTAADQMYVGGFAPSGAANTVQFSVNGARTSQNNWMIDGADNVDRGASLTVLTFPSVDAIAEFRLVRGSYDPEFGRNAGGQVNVITRSGTSTFHGGAYEFWRNDLLNANSWFNKHYADPTKYIKRPVLRYNNFGWTLGGPVYIPGVYNEKKNKTFFFFSQEWRKYITYANPSATVPTANERNGIFATPVCTSWSTNVGPATCLSTGTTIPTSAMSPLARAYLQDVWSKVPLPNPAAGEDVHLLHSTWNNVFDFREELLKIDHIFNDRYSVSGKMLRDDIPTEEPGGIYSTASVPGMATTRTNSPGHTYTGHFTGAVSPTFLIDANYAYSYGAIVSTPVGYTLLANSPDIHATLPFVPSHPRIPNITLSGGHGVAGVGPYKDYNYNHAAFGSVTKVWRNHSFKFGTSYNHYRKTENNTGGTEGTFAFNNAGMPTGVGTITYMQSFANFLLGHSSNFTQSAVDITPDIYQNSIELFAQDSWRVRPNLTLSYGVRWSIFRQPYDAKNQISNFDPGAYDPAKAPCITASGNIDAACNPNYDPLNGFVIGGVNSPFGRKVTNEQMNNFAPRIGLAWDPFKDGKTSVRAGYGVFYDTILVGSLEFDVLFNPYLVNSVSVPNTSLDNPMAGTPSVSAAPKRVYARAPRPWNTPYTEQYSLDIQHEFFNGYMLDIGYYGSQGHHLIGVLDINQPLPAAYRTLVPVCPASTPNCLAAGAQITGSTTYLLNAIRPYLGYTGIDAMSTIFNSNYHSLQVQFQKQFSGGSLINVAYTWSKALTNNQTDRSTAPQSSYDIAAEYGPMQQDRTHVFTANYIWSLPWFRDQKGFVGRTLGGWEFSGIVQAWTGVPLTVTTSQSVDPAGTGCLGPSPCGVRPNQIGNPNQGAPNTQSQWFNKSAFELIPAGQYFAGTAGRGTVRGPGLQNWNLALFKNIKITERINSQFRVETFNAFNHTNWDTVSTNISAASFGQITGTRSARIAQLGLKLNF